MVFRFVLGSDFSNVEDGFTFDDFSISEVVDVEVVAVAMPTYGAFTSTTSIVASIRNLGAQPISGFEMSYVVDGNLPAIRETFTGTIAPNETQQFTFGSQVDFSALGAHSVSVRASLAGDIDNSNNSKFKNIATLAYVNTFPYTESFEGTDGGWFGFTENANELVSWERGVPTGVVIDAASDGTEAWVTNLDGNYPNNEDSYLISPVFDFGTFDPVLIADINRQLEKDWDGVSLQFSLNGGETWENLGENGDPNNWFNGNIGALAFSGGNGDAWSGENPIGYQEIGRFLPNGTGNQLILRFAFGSDGSGPREGFALDNVRFIDRSTITSFVNCDTIFVNTDPGLATATVSAPAPALNNATGSETIMNDITNTDDASGVYSLGATTITWTLTVPGGFTEVCEQVVLVSDAEAPVIADCPSDILLIVESNVTDTIVTFTPPSGATDNVGFTRTYTQSLDQTLAPGAVKCPTAPNSFIRIFDLENEFGITGDAPVSSFEFGVETSDTESAVVNFYAYDASLPLSTSSFTFLGSSSTSVPAGDLFMHTVPVSGVTVPAGELLVAEVFYTGTTMFLAGRASDVESYIVAPVCGAADLTTMTDIGFPASQWIMNVDIDNSLELLYTLESGERFPLGVTDQAYGIEDAAGNADTCVFTVTVLNDIEALEATNVTNAGFTANWTESPGTDEYLLDISENSDFSTFIVQDTSILVGTESYAYYNRVPSEARTLYYRVRVKKGATILPYSNTMKVNLIPPSIVALPASNIVNGGFTANWETLSESVDWVAIQLSKDSFATVSQTIQVNDADDFEEFASLDPTTYQYRLRAAWDFGDDTTYSSYSDSVTVLLNEILALEATNITNSGFTANWEAFSGADRYLIDIAEDASFTSLVVSDSPITGTETFEYYERVAGDSKGYYFRLKAANGDLIAPYGNTIKVNLPAPSITALPASNITETSFTANWTAIAESADWIEFERSTTAFATSNISMLTGSTTNTSENVTGIVQADYQYRLRTAWLFDGDTTYSAYSNIIGITPKPNAPTNLVATASLAEETPEVQLDWTANNTNPTVFQWVEKATVVGSGDWRPLTDGAGNPIRLDASTNTYTDTEVEQGVIYAYRVVAVSPDFEDPTNATKFVKVYSNEALSGIVSSTADNLLDRTTLVSPNPSKGLFRIDMNNSYNGALELKVYDVAGKTLIVQEIEKSGASFGRTIDLTNKKSGMYILRISSANGFILRKLVKE